MILVPIHRNQELNKEFSSNPACGAILEVYPSFYERVGYNPPWIGYFAIGDHEVIGGGGFKGAPKNGQVEIAYTTFSNFERQGFGTEICRQLIMLSLETDRNIVITARTLLNNNTSSGILKRNGFESRGQIWDDEDGQVWEWIYKNNG